MGLRPTCLCGRAKSQNGKDRAIREDVVQTPIAKNPFLPSETQGMNALMTPRPLVVEPAAIIHVILIH